MAAIDRIPDSSLQHAHGCFTGRESRLHLFLCPQEDRGHLQAELEGKFETAASEMAALEQQLRGLRGQLVAAQAAAKDAATQSAEVESNLQVQTSLSKCTLHAVAGSWMPISHPTTRMTGLSAYCL